MSERGFVSNREDGRTELVHINAVKHFPDEFKIQQAWMRQSPPDTPNPGFAFANRMRRLKSLLSEGINSGAIRNEETSLEVLSRCVISVLWIPQSIVESMAAPDALTLARDTWLRAFASGDVLRRRFPSSGGD